MIPSPCNKRVDQGCTAVIKVIRTLIHHLLLTMWYPILGLEPSVGIDTFDRIVKKSLFHRIQKKIMLVLYTIRSKEAILSVSGLVN